MGSRSKNMKIADLEKPLSSDSEMGDSIDSGTYADFANIQGLAPLDSSGPMKKGDQVRINKAGTNKGKTAEITKIWDNGMVKVQIGSSTKSYDAEDLERTGLDSSTPMRLKDMHKFNNGVTSMDLLTMVQNDVEYQEGLLAKLQETNVTCISGLAERILKGLILMVAAPVLLVALFVVFFQICLAPRCSDDMAVTDVDCRGYDIVSLRFLGLVFVPALSYAGCAITHSAYSCARAPAH